jgi:succinate-semialdehyde dehydrogenase / glutarate-semialdehyde dehydrogenase
VHESLADDFSRTFARAMADLTMGPGYAAGTELGPLINAEARGKVGALGGMKQSGIGREGGHEGMLEYTETKYIATSW